MPTPPPPPTERQQQQQPQPLHAVFFNIALYGHVAPTLPIVERLVARGWKVTYFVTRGGFADRLAAVGAEGRVVEPLAAGPLGDKPSLLELPVCSLEAMPWVLRELRSMTPPAAVIAYDVLAMWGGWSAQVLGIRSVCSSSTFVLDPAEFTTMQATPTAEHLAAIAELSGRYGIKVCWSDALTDYGRVNLVYTARELQPEGAWSDVSGRIFHFVGPMLREPAELGVGAADAEAEADAHTAPAPGDDPVVEIRATAAAGPYDSVVLVSMGTAVHSSCKFWRQVERAFPAESRVLLVCALGRYAKDELANTHPVGPNVLAYPRVPQERLLAEPGLVGAFVTHAGMNSVHEALWHGVPMVCVPHVGDQISNADVVQDRGCGLMLDVYDVTTVTLREAVQAVLADAVYRDRCAHFKQLLRAGRSGGGNPEVAAQVIIDTAAAHTTNPI